MSNRDGLFKVTIVLKITIIQTIIRQEFGVSGLTAESEKIRMVSSCDRYAKPCCEGQATLDNYTKHLKKLSPIVGSICVSRVKVTHTISEFGTDIAESLAHLLWNCHEWGHVHRNIITT